jgi:hypothetical protein
MATTSNMLTETSEIKNKGFILLDATFKEKGWQLIKNEMNRICYTKFGNETDVYDIKIDAKCIHVSIPLKNSPFNYITSFKDYFSASEYIEEHL